MRFLLLTLLLVSPLRAADSGASSGSLAPIIQPYLDQQALAGVIIAVADKDKILDFEPLGYADVAAKKPMAADTLFCIASMSKAMTCAALMTLVDQGKVSLDDPVEKFLPEFAGQKYIAEQDENHLVAKKPTHPILIRNLMSHTSGLAPFSPVEQPPGSHGVTPKDVLPLEVAVRIHAMSLLKYDPGTSYEYSNAGINTAGRVIEVVGGMPYAQYMKKNLFDPCGMTDATFLPTAEQAARVAKTYESLPGLGLKETVYTHLHYPLDLPDRQPIPAGGVICSTGDEIKFCQMLLNHGMVNGHAVLSPAAVQAMTSVETGPILVNGSDQAGYGFGLAILKKDQHASGLPAGSYQHAGSDKTEMAVDPKDGLIMVFMVQQQKPFPNHGKKMVSEFEKAALAKYAGQ